MSDEAKLPADVLARATRSGTEYAWSISDIPLVIEAARQANLINIGGQLQFILNPGICDCYWIEVDTYKSVAKTLPWDQRVEQTARVALTAFEKLRAEKDFVAEGMKAFPDHLSKYEADGGKIADAMRFIWYIEAQPNL